MIRHIASRANATLDVSNVDLGETGGVASSASRCESGIALKREMQELIKSALLIVREGVTIDEAASPIKRQSWFKGRATASFKAKPLNSSRLCDRDNSFEDRGGRTGAQKVRVCSHRLHLGGGVLQHLQGADTGNAVVAPSGPNGHVGTLQT